MGKPATSTTPQFGRPAAGTGARAAPRKRQPKAAKDPRALASLDLRWAYERDDGDHVTDGDIEYAWTADAYWRALEPLESRRAAWRWLIKEAPDKASDSQAKACSAAALLHLSPVPGEALKEATGAALVPTRSGYVSVAEDGAVTVIPADRALGVRHVVACEYAPDASAPRFERFLAEVLPDEDVRAVVQEYIGYTLTRDTRYQVAQVWIGNGGNGKGTLSQIISALHERVASVKLENLEGFGLQPIIGASLIVVDETPQGKFADQTLKSLVSGDPVPIDRKHRDAITYRSPAKWVLCGNHTLKTSDSSDGFWRRWQYVPFTAKPKEGKAIPNLGRLIIRHELAGVLRWAIEGLSRLQKRGGFGEMPEAIQAAKMEARRETDSVAAWVADREATTTPGVMAVAKDAVYADYRDYCQKNGANPTGAPQFWKRIGGLLPDLEESRLRVKTDRIHAVNLVWSGCESARLSAQSNKRF